MQFTLRPGLICFSDNQPGNHATMFVSSETLLFREDESSFDDVAHDYTWAFEWAGVPNGQLFVFATADREVAGIAKDANVGLVPFRGRIERGAEGKPEWLIDEKSRSRLVLAGPSVISRAKPSRGVRCMFVNPVIPYNQWACYKAGVMNEASFSAHGSAYVSAALKNQGHTTFLVDFRSMNSWAHVESVLRQQEFDVAFVGFLSIDAFHAAAAVRLLKELHPTKPVVVGGLHVSIAKEREFPRDDLVERYAWGKNGLLPGSFLEFLQHKGEASYIPSRYPKADYVILDDGETAAQTLVAELAAGRRPAERTLDGGAVAMEVARHMDRDLFRLDFEAYSPILPFQPTPMATVTWARGCSYKCTYSVTGDTIIYTEDGPTTIAELASGVGEGKACKHGGEVLEYQINKHVVTSLGMRLATKALAEGVRPVFRVVIEGSRAFRNFALGDPRRGSSGGLTSDPPVLYETTIKATGEQKILCYTRTPTANPSLPETGYLREKQKYLLGKIFQF